MPARQPFVLLGAAAALALAAAALMARPAAPGDTAPQRVAAPCAMRDVPLGGELHRLVAVCTRASEGRRDATPGRIDLYLLRQEGDDWQTAAQQLGIESGSSGQPGDVSVLQLAPGVYAFQIDETAVSQGYLLGSTRLYVPVDGRFQVALDLTSSVKNSGTHDCATSTPPACTDLSRRLEVLAREGGAPGLRVTSLGSHRGRPVSTKHLLPYDTRRHHYRLPAGFEAHVE